MIRVSTQREFCKEIGLLLEVDWRTSAGCFRRDRQTRRDLGYRFLDGLVRNADVLARLVSCQVVDTRLRQDLERNGRATLRAH